MHKLGQKPKELKNIKIRGKERYGQKKCWLPAQRSTTLVGGTKQPAAPHLLYFIAVKACRSKMVVANSTIHLFGRKGTGNQRTTPTILSNHSKEKVLATRSTLNYYSWRNEATSSTTPTMILLQHVKNKLLSIAVPVLRTVVAGSLYSGLEKSWLPAGTGL